MRRSTRSIPSFSPALRRRAALLAALALLALPIVIHAATSAAPKTAAKPKTGQPASKPAGRSKPAAPSKTPAELAREARLLEEAGAYGQAAEVLRTLRRRVAPDTDLELALALDEARSEQLDSAWVRLNTPLMNKGVVDSLPHQRRTDYPWERDAMWINGRFDGWYWYIARSRAEVAARLGLWAAARDAAARAADARPLVGREWYILAVCAGRAGDLALAEAMARQATMLDLSLPEAQYLHGLYEWKTGRRGSGQAHFRVALALDSTYQAPALALVRSQLLSSMPDTLPTTLLTGVREIGLLTSPLRPKLEEFQQNDVAPKLLRLVNPVVPDSLRGKFPEAELALSLLIDEQGHVVLHELPWYEPFRFPAPMVSILTAGLPNWRFEPAIRHGAGRMTWAVIQVGVKS